MNASADPYLLASTILTPNEHLKIALVAKDPQAQDSTSLAASSTISLPQDNSASFSRRSQRIFVIVSNVGQSVEQSCILVLKPRNKDPNTAALLKVIPILPDFRVDIGQKRQELLLPKGDPISGKTHTFGLPSIPRSLPTVQSLLETALPDFFGPSKSASSDSELTFTFTYGSQKASGCTSDTEGLKDFLSVLRDLLKIAQDHHFSLATTHQWLSAYTDDIPSLGQKQYHATKALETPVFSRFSTSAFRPNEANTEEVPRPVSPTSGEIRISCGTFNVGGNWPHDDNNTIMGLKKWLKADEDPDLIVVGFQEADTSSGAYLYYSPAREEAWTRAAVQSLGRRAGEYEKVASKQLVGLLILMFVRSSLKDSISNVATASVGVGLGGFVANKGAVAIRLQIARRTFCFVNSHLSAFEGLQAMERRCWDWSEIYKRLRFKLVRPRHDDFWETPAMQGSIEEQPAPEETSEDLGDLSVEHSINPFQTAQDADKESVKANSAQGSTGDEAEMKETLNGDGHPQADEAPDEKVEAALEAKIDNAMNETLPVEDVISDDISAQVKASPSMEQVEFAIMDHDIIIHFGDLNFRVDISHSEAHRLIHQRQYALLHRYDQLESLRTSGSLFDDFEEGEVKFAPTYKFDKGTDRYDTSEKQRVPSWTDRILWCVTQEWEDVGTEDLESLKVEEDDRKKILKQRKQGLVLQSYESVPEIKFSDHKPVRATFLARIQ